MGPHGVGNHAIGRSGKNRCGVDENIESAEGATVARKRLADGFAIANIDAAATAIPYPQIALVRRPLLRLRQIAVGDHDMRAAFGRQQRDFAADAAAAADDEAILAAELLLRRLAANLRLFQRPVFDAEGLDAGSAT